MDAAGVVADHAADGAAAVRCGVRRERHVLPFGGFAHTIENDSGLHACVPGFKVHLEDGVHVAGKVEDDGDVAALAGQAGASAAREQWRIEFAARGNGRRNVCFIQGADNTDRHLPVIGGVRCIEGACASIERHVAAHGAAQFRFQFSMTGERFVRKSTGGSVGIGHRSPFEVQEVRSFRQPRALVQPDRAEGRFDQWSNSMTVTAIVCSAWVVVCIF